MLQGTEKHTGEERLRQRIRSQWRNLITATSQTITSERLQGRAATASLAAVTHSALILAPGLARGAVEELLKHHLYL